MDAETREKLYGVIITMIFAAVIVSIGPGLITFLAGTDSNDTVYAGFKDLFDRFNDNMRTIVVAILGLFMLAAIAKLRLSEPRGRKRPCRDGADDAASGDTSRRCA